MALSDEDITKMAKERVAFKQHAAAYVLVNLLLIGIWSVANAGAGERGWSGFWPVWSLLGWGIGLAFHGFNAYGPERGMLAKEEERVRRKYG